METLQKKQDDASRTKLNLLLTQEKKNDAGCCAKNLRPHTRFAGSLPQRTENTAPIVFVSRILLIKV